MEHQQADKATNNMQLRVSYRLDDVPRLKRAYAGDAGWDLTGMLVEQWGESLFAFDCGLSVEPPAGYYCEVVARSSLCKEDFMLANGVGVIDAGYRGPILAVLRYLGTASSAKVAADKLLGKRIAQLLVRRLERVQVVSKDSSTETTRGEGGFGSSGT